MVDTIFAQNTQRHPAPEVIGDFREFVHRREGMIYAMDGGLWLHRHLWKGRLMAHLVSTDRERLLDYGRSTGLSPNRLQFKPLKDPRTGRRKAAWHWDLVGRFLPPPAERELRARPAMESQIGGALIPLSAERTEDHLSGTFQSRTKATNIDTTVVATAAR